MELLLLLLLLLQVHSGSCSEPVSSRGTRIRSYAINPLGHRWTHHNLTYSSVVQVLASGEWNYTLQMSAYQDQQLLHVVQPETELLLNQRVWLELKTEGLDENRVSIVTDSCWATSQSSPNDTLRYDLINSGCPNANDETVRLSGNGQGTSNVFSFNMFKFNGGNREIFLHCKLELCVRMGSSCQPTCTPRSRRRRRASKYVDKHPAIISMSWTK